MRIEYPVLFTKTQKGIFLIEVKDLRIYSQSLIGDLAQAINIARDAIGLRLLCLDENNERIPEPSLSLDISKGAFSNLGDTIISHVDLDLYTYKQKLTRIIIGEKGFGKNLNNFLESTIDHNSVIHVRSEKGNVIVLSEQDYNGLLEIVYFRTLPLR